MGAEGNSRSSTRIVIGLFEIGVKIEPGKRYVYVDYEPPEDARFRRPATYKEIRAWIMLE